MKKTEQPPKEVEPKPVSFTQFVEETAEFFGRLPRFRVVRVITSSGVTEKKVRTNGRIL